MEKISNDYRENVRMLDGLLGVGRSCDMVSRDYLIGGRRARLWVVDGFGSDSILERMGAFWLTLKPENVMSLTEMQDFLDRYITFSESNVTFDISDAVTSVFLGKSLLAVEGLAGVALMDAKGYPSRSVHEPPDGKVLRGSHDGFVEAVVPNMALLRRRIRDPHLTMEGHKVGSRTHNDAVLCYLDDKVDQDLLRKLRGKLLGLDVRSLSMAQESLAEAIRPKQWYNPFPKVRYTERPDAAAASIMEGSIVLMVDNSPSVMILPTGFFDFTQESNDYYFPPLVGTYLRVLRVTVFLLSLFITPAWYLMVSEPNRLPGWLNFLSSPEPVSLSLLSQLLVVEFLIDVLKLASLNTPDSLSNSFSMLGALVLGDFAVQAGWLGPEVLVYMAFVSVAGFAQPSYELGYAFKLLRVALLLVTAAFDVWGFCLGVVGIFILLCTTKPLVGKGYLYPLVPFNGKALLRLLVREPISRDNT
ncbi:spore germination protein [Dysosmobacter sp.]|mgnify:FL=1|jgi:stage V sporulation protein AF|uniref:spore germination protein n=1 Tax=Dysosmobacter sp. TaxID=2591382 RepID=UPI00267116EB|nr:spore germination protein [Dysosmobacter sp.]MCI6015918.1 spore germination protein [Dysosmobacter sp.]MCI7214269.1 spore germination protein [Dysosmobacter sp.]MCI7282571.1 spore germination protein [Dysosmobacter sp.]MDY3652438.1 spore germination protein [Dysosmobacter sp.]